jgi:hypothetical protein
VARGEITRAKGRHKHTIQDECVRAYARFKATPLTLREALYGKGMRSEEDYLRSIGRDSRFAPESWLNTPGFWDLVRKLEREFHTEYVLRAKNTLMRRMEGMKTTRTTIKRDAQGVEIERTVTEDVLAPDVHAAEVALRAHGALKDGLGDAAASLAEALTAAAKQRRDEKGAK